MVHPTALSGKTTHSLIDIGEAVASLLFREYNKDARPGKISYREVGMPPLKNKYLGCPSVAVSALPYIAVSFSTINYEDAPQEAGSDNEVEIKIYTYGQEKRQEKQLQEAIKMVEALRHIILDNPTVPTAEGVEQVYFLGYRQMRIDFADEVYENFNSESIGVKIGIITASAVFAEKGF